MALIPDEVINRVEKMDILQVANHLGLEVRKVGNGYRAGKNNAYQFYTDTNKFSNYYAGQKGGNTINLVQYEQGFSFVEAVNYLADLDFSEVEVDLTPKKKPPFQWNFQTVDFPRRAENYLVNERKLPQNMVKLLLERRYIVEDKLGNIVFPWYKNGTPVGADVRGTTYQEGKKRPYFVGIASHSEHFGFNIKIGSGDVTDLYFFEAPIDALSYWSLHPELTNCMFISVSGAENWSKVEPFMNYAAATYGYGKDGRNPHHSVHICVDNDKKGAEFWEHFEAKNAFTKEFSVGNVEYYVDERPDEAFGKDWNDVLKFQTLRLEQEKATTIPQQEQEMAY